MAKIDIEKAFSNIPKKATIVTAMAAAEPKLFFQNLLDFVPQDADWKIYLANPSENFPCFTDQSLVGRVDFLPMFLTPNIRRHQGHGLVHYIPSHLSQWSKHIIESGPIDLFWGSCSESDSNGHISLGLSNCYESEIARHAKKVVLEQNPNTPRTFGSTILHENDVDQFIQVDYNLPTIPPATADETDIKIAQNIVDMIADGSTLQLGIGGIPNAVAGLLRDKKNLGIHTEMINDAMMNLYKSGVINGTQKTIWPRKIVGAFALGSPELYKFIHNHMMIEFHPAQVVNDPIRIGQNHKMVSLNTAVEIDLTGQVCSESIGHLEISGVGGASETHIGAQRSRGGKGIIAVKSMSKRGESKIVSALKPGAKVSISRNDIDYVVTENGVTRLKGKSVGDRAKLLISLAHPSERERLLHDAKHFQYI